MFDSQTTRIPIFPFGMINAHLIRDETGCIFVDTGIPGSEKTVKRVVKCHGLGFCDINLIVVTRAHMDHAGAAARLQALYGRPDPGLPGRRRFLCPEEGDDACPTGPLRRFFVKTPLPHQPYEASEPDIMMRNGETANLLGFGVDGTVRHAGGHTLGSVAIELASQEALVGDLLSSGILLGGIARKGHAIRPPFEDDPHHVADALQHLVQRGLARFHMGYGGPCTRPEVIRHARKLPDLPTIRRAAGCSHSSHA